MRPRRLPTATALGLVGALLLSSATQAAGVGACVGADGHTAVEPALASCCGAVAAPPAGAEPGLSGDPSSCGDCTDVRLELVPLRPEGPHLAPPADPDAGRVAPPPGPGRATRAAAPADGDRRGLALALLATVVLLT